MTHLASYTATGLDARWESATITEYDDRCTLNVVARSYHVDGGQHTARTLKLAKRHFSSEYGAPGQRVCWVKQVPDQAGQPPSS